jgi:3-hydroxyisobutyrate dehydrogenase-like beta-hydroxyacid dehydrogenase
MQSGFRVIGFSLTNLDRFAETGGVAAKSAADVAAQCDVIINCLPVAAALDEAAYGPQGILKTLRKGAVVIELSSYLLKDKERRAPPNLARPRAARLAARRRSMVTSRVCSA